MWDWDLISVAKFVRPGPKLFFNPKISETDISSDQPYYFLPTDLGCPDFLRPNSLIAPQLMPKVLDALQIA